MALTAAQLNAYAADQSLVTADQSKLTADETTETTDASTIASGLAPGGQAVLSPDSTSVTVFVPSSSPPGFVATNYPLTS